MRFCCMVVRRGPAVYDTMYGLTLYELISLRALLRLRGRRSVAALPAAPCAAWRPLLRRTAGTRATTALGSRWSRGLKAPLDEGGVSRASRSCGGEPEKVHLLLEQRLLNDRASWGSR